jgi:hypothetical protein
MGEPAFTALEEAFFAEGDAMSAIPEDIEDEPTSRIESRRGFVIVDDEYYASVQLGSDVVSGEIIVLTDADLEAAA